MTLSKTLNSVFFKNYFLSLIKALKMDLQTRKLELIDAFLKIQSEEIIIRLEKIIKKEKNKSSQEDFKPMSRDTFNARIDQSMEDSKNGNLIEQSVLKAKIGKWT